MIKPRLFLCGNISLNNDDPLCEGRHPVALATHGPNAMDATESWMMQDYEHWEKRRIAKQAKGINLQFPLRVAVQKWPTPTSTERSGVNPNKPDVIQGLTHAVKLAEFPTPCASDSKDRGGMYNPAIQMRVEKGKQIQLSMVARYKAGGSLNPDWVEWLMNWPTGWTSLEPMSRDVFNKWMQITKSGNWWAKEPAGVPRVATGVKDRVARLKAIGNGQVALCAATAWKLLTEILPRHQFPNV